MYQVLVFFTALFITLFATPSLIKVAYLKRLFDMPDFERKMHTRAVPTIGGIIIFASTMFAYALWYPSVYVGEFKYIVVCMLILFFVGIKDDIIGTAPVKKLLAHFLVGLILVLMGGIKLTSLHGMFGVEEIPEYAGVFLSLFTYIVIVNAFNLIDGIDGLAGGIGLIASFAFGSWFYLTSDYGMAVLAFALSGALSGFLVFNFYPARLFMGDSGSLTIGLIISVLAIKLIEQDVSQIPSSLIHVSRPVFAMAVLIYPLYDTLRVFIYRTIKGVSPFSADKKHIHHRMLKIGFSHAQTALLLYAANLLVIFFCIIFSEREATALFVLVAVLVLLLAQLPFLKKSKNA